MPKSIRPPRPRAYNQEKFGVYGEFGSSAGIRVFYLQTTISPDELKKITLISDIKGSERWPVLELFQRDVDNDRVEKELLAYLRKPGTIKFFNPLTLTTLPFDGEAIHQPIPIISKTSMNEDEQEWMAWTHDDFYRFRHLKEEYWTHYGKIEWNDNKTKLVAIDGQHRLSALKRLYSDTNSTEEFSKWNIPVIILSCSKEGSAGENGNGQSILRVIRSIFININREAKEPTRSRQILLSDSEINAICVQEILNCSHENDLKSTQDQSEEIPPLIIYNWREARKGEPSPSIFNVEEIHDWLETYILGEDFSTEQEVVLGIDPMHPLKGIFTSRELSMDVHDSIRTLVREGPNSGIIHLIGNFEPLRKYISGIKKIENELTSQTDVARHAFYKLRFGSNQGEESIQNDINEKLSELHETITNLKSSVLEKPLETPFNDLIGMRGVMSAFGSWELRKELSLFLESEDVVDWIKYARWFTQSLNQAYSAGYLGTDSRKRSNLLLHVIEDHGGAVVNYRLDQVGEAFGAYIALFVAAFTYSRGELLESSWMKIRDGDDWTLDTLHNTIFRGYKKEVRLRLKENEELRNDPEQLKKAIEKDAKKLAKAHIQRIRNVTDKITKSRSSQTQK